MSRWSTESLDEIPVSQRNCIMKIGPQHKIPLRSWRGAFGKSG